MIQNLIKEIGRTLIEVETSVKRVYMESNGSADELKLLNEANVKISDAIGMLKDLKALTGFISVKDRLPENGEQVWVYLVNEAFPSGTMAFAVYDLDFGETPWFFDDDCCLKTGAVTHWMPLPQAPQSN